jgi:hypothetical protein
MATVWANWPDCVKCGKKIRAKDSSVGVMGSEFAQHTHDERAFDILNEGSGAFTLADPNIPDLVSWHWWHDGCTPNDVLYSMDVRRVETITPFI